MNWVTNNLYFIKFQNPYIHLISYISNFIIIYCIFDELFLFSLIEHVHHIEHCFPIGTFYVCVGLMLCPMFYPKTIKFDTFFCKMNDHMVSGNIQKIFWQLHYKDHKMVFHHFHLHIHNRMQEWKETIWIHVAK